MMKRISFLLALSCCFTIVADATAQQCCSRRPILRRSNCSGVCSPIVATTQSIGTACSTSYPIAATAHYATNDWAAPAPLSSLGCCGQNVSGTVGLTPTIASPVIDSTTSTTLPSQPVVAGATATMNAPGFIQQASPMSAMVASAPVASTFAQPSYVMPTYTQTSMRVTQQYSGAIGNGALAQRKAERAAQMRLRGHLGGSLGGARYEGVGWSNVSPQMAIQSCCYWGQRPASQIGVARGNDGCWYACVLYR